MEKFYVALISVLLGSNILWGGMLMKIYSTAHKKLVDKTNQNEMDAAMLTKDVNDLYRDSEAHKQNIYSMRTTMQIHNDRILILEQKRKRDGNNTE